MGDLWKETIINAFRDFGEKMTGFLPSLLAMLSIIVLGTVLSWVSKWIFAYLLKKIRVDHWSDRYGLSSILRNAGMKKPTSEILSLILFWILFISFLMIGINALQIPPASLLISQFFGYLPRAIAAILILIVGWILANFLGQAALLGAVNAGIDFGPFIARVVRWSVIILASCMALIHFGIAEQIVVAMFSILFGGFILALAIAFGLGGKELAKAFLEKKMRIREEGEKEKKEEISHL